MDEITEQTTEYYRVFKSWGSLGHGLLPWSEKLIYLNTTPRSVSYRNPGFVLVKWGWEISNGRNSLAYWASDLFDFCDPLQIQIALLLLFPRFLLSSNSDSL
jgi:hypothetical protein